MRLDERVSIWRASHARLLLPTGNTLDALGAQLSQSLEDVACEVDVFWHGA